MCGEKESPYNPAVRESNQNGGVRNELRMIMREKIELFRMVNRRGLSEKE